MGAAERFDVYRDELSSLFDEFELEIPTLVRDSDATVAMDLGVLAVLLSQCLLEEP